MNARALLVFGLTVLLATGPVAAATITELRVEWEAVPRGERAVVRGYVYNQHRLRAENIRLRIEQLDAGARPVATRVVWVPGTISYGDRSYFETTVPAGTTTRVSIESFDRAGCGEG
jgi:hypothetical protein